MAWKLIEVSDEEENALSDSELIGISIMLRENMGEPYDERSVYLCAWRKLQSAVDKAIDNG